MILAYLGIIIKELRLAPSGGIATTCPSGPFYIPEGQFTELLTDSTVFIYTHITEAFISYFKLSVILSFLFITPYTINSIIRFIIPGLHQKEYARRGFFQRVIPFLIYITYPFFCFILGYYLIPNIIYYLSVSLELNGASSYIRYAPSNISLSQVSH